MTVQIDQAIRDLEQQIMLNQASLAIPNLNLDTAPRLQTQTSVSLAKAKQAVEQEMARRKELRSWCEGGNGFFKMILLHLSPEVFEDIENPLEFQHQQQKAAIMQSFEALGMMEAASESDDGEESEQSGGKPQPEVPAPKPTVWSDEMREIFPEGTIIIGTLKSKRYGVPMVSFRYTLTQPMSPPHTMSVKILQEPRFEIGECVTPWQFSKWSHDKLEAIFGKFLSACPQSLFQGNFETKRNNMIRVSYLEI